MQIFGKYDGDYRKACLRFADTRDEFSRQLSDIPFLRVIPSQANYFLCEVLPPFTSHELTLRLLTDADILIKDCSTKKGFPKGSQYVRIAVRDSADNRALVEALKTLV